MNSSLLFSDLDLKSERLERKSWRGSIRKNIDPRTDDEIRASVEKLQKDFEGYKKWLHSIDLDCRNKGHDVGRGANGGELNAALASRAQQLREDLEDLRKFRDRGWYRRALEMHMLDFDYYPPVYIRDGGLIAALIEAWEQYHSGECEPAQVAILATP